MEAKDRIIVALDVSNIQEAIGLAYALNGHVGGFKLGLEWMTCGFADLLTTQNRNEAMILLDKYRRLYQLVGDSLMWDGKFHDIPNTMEGATKNVGRLGPKYFTIHASSGTEAMKRVAENCGGATPVAVTVLTSIDDQECVSIFGDRPMTKVFDFVKLALDAGVTHIVCAPGEANALRQPEEYGKVLELTEHPRYKDLRLITPGTRPKFATKVTDDQNKARRRTIGEALAIDPTRRFVIGRPITKAVETYGLQSPHEAVYNIIAEIEEALGE